MPWSYPYRAVPQTPYWGRANAQANFCEEDYIITAYIAEFINTLSNATYLLYAYHGIKSNSNRKDAILRNMPYLGIAGVGIGSTVFHATMKNYTQWCDDTSMLIATATVLHRVFTFDKSLSMAVVSGLLYASLMAAFVNWHIKADETLMHSIVFGIMIVAVGHKTRHIIKARVSDLRLRKQLRILAKWGAVFFGSGFALWNVDNVYCGSITNAKRSIGLPWAFVLELHGWWHILTGIGAYIFIALVEYLTSEEVGEPLGRRLAWPARWLVDGSVGHNKLSGSDVGALQTNNALEKKVE